MTIQAKTKKIAVQEIAIALLMLIIISLFQLAYIYTGNIEFLTVSDVAPYALLFVGIAVFISAILFFILKSLYKAAFFGCVFIMLFINYRQVEGLFQFILPRAGYWHLAPTIIIIYALLVYWGAKKISVETYKKICIAVLIPFGLLTLLNFFIAIPAIINRDQTQDAIPQEAGQIQDIAPPDKPYDLPNIYFFIFDEYGGFEALENLYGYSNSEFEQFLEYNNFTVSRSSRNNSIATVVLLTNLFNLDYVVSDEMPRSEILSRLLDTKSLFTLLEAHGYNIRGVGETEFISLYSESGEMQAAAQVQTIEGYDLEQLLLSRTLLYPFFHINQTGEIGDRVLNAFAYINKIENIPNEPTFTFFYTVSPHQPFLFDRDGNAVNSRNWHNWSDPQFYLEQLQFINKLTTETVEFLLAEDPDSIIILQSDHGPRQFGGTFDDQTNILNAVYFRGEPISEIDGLSGVNTLRAIFDRLLGIDMPILEVP